MQQLFVGRTRKNWAPLLNATCCPRGVYFPGSKGGGFFFWGGLPGGGVEP